MPSQTASERIKINKELKRMGLGGLEDRNLCSQIAFFIRNHEQFRGMLMAVTPDKRHEAYKALAPKLRFPARPLHVYETEIHEKAEREQWPTLKPGEVYPEPFKVSEIGEISEKDRLAKRIEDAIPAPSRIELVDAPPSPAERNLTLTCAHCLIEETFCSWARIMAEFKATDAGWYSEGDKSWCPAHAPRIN